MVSFIYQTIQGQSEWGTIIAEAKSLLHASTTEREVCSYSFLNKIYLQDKNKGMYHILSKFKNVFQGKTQWNVYAKKH